MQASILNLIGMALLVGVLITPYALLRSLDTRSYIKFIILALTFALALLHWPYALSFMLSVIVPAFIVHRLHKSVATDNVHWLPIAISPLLACAAVLVWLAINASNLPAMSAEAIDVLYSEGLKINMKLPARDDMVKQLDNTIRLSPSLVYIVVAALSYFTERAYYAPRAQEPRIRIMPVPDFFIGLLLASVLLMALPYIIGDNILISAIGKNGLLIVASIYFFRGLDIIKYYLARWQFSPFMTIAVYMLMLIFWPIMVVVIATLGFASVYVKIVNHEEA